MYITGTGVIINNIDLYFEEALEQGINVEILKPNCIKDNPEAMKKIKEIVEVNSAISLAVTPDIVSACNINFKVMSIFNKIHGYISSENPIKKNVKIKSNNQIRRVSFVRKTLISFLSILLICYIGVTSILSNKYDKSISEVNAQISNVNAEIKKIENDTTKIKVNSEKYVELKKEIDSLVEKMNQINGVSQDVSSLLTQIALVVPDEVVITKITINGSVVLIDAESDLYAPLGFFISSLKVENVMKNISTTLTSGTKAQSVTIRGVII